MKVQALCRGMPILGSALAVLDCAQLHAQEALGDAIQVERSRKARKESIDKNRYNYKAGPVLMRFDALMGFEFNDNPNLIENPGEVDWAFHPQLDISTLWPVNQLNALSLNLGVGYRKYVNNTDLDQLIISPDSELSIDIYTGDFIINAHERVSYTQDPVTDPSVSGTGDFGGLENTVGVRADWNLNQLSVAAGYDHYNFFSTGSVLSDVQERSSERLYGSTAMQLSRGLKVGLETGGAFTDYTKDVFSDNTEFTVGPYAELELSPQLRFRLSGGYLHYDFDEAKGDASITNAVPNVPTRVDDFYGDFTVEHQVSKYMGQRLSLGREARAGATSELLTLYYVRYGNDWNLSKYTVLKSQVFYENGRDRAGFATDRFWRVGLGLGVTVPITKQFSTGAGYQLTYKDSDQDNQDYLQNLVSLEFHYVF